MPRLRLFFAVFVLVFAPLTGAFASAVGAGVSHHHCDDVWHGHANGDVVHADENCDSAVPNLDPSSCEDCQIAITGLPIATFIIAPTEPEGFPTTRVISAQARFVFSLFRPPKI